MTDLIELSAADSQASGGILDSLQPLHQLICDAEQSAITVVQPVADKRVDDGPESFSGMSVLTLALCARLSWLLVSF